MIQNLMEYWKIILPQSLWNQWKFFTVYCISIDLFAANLITELVSVPEISFNHFGFNMHQDVFC